MSITVTKTGPASACLAATATVYTDLANAVRDFLVGNGWELFDNSNANARVFRAVCADGLTYKFIRLAMAPGAMTVYAHETWDATGHTGGPATLVNPNGTNALTYPIDAVGSINYYLFATNRYFYIYSLAGGSARVGGGIFEFARDTPNDTAAAGYPCFFFSTESGLATGIIGNGVGSVGGVPRSPQHTNAVGANYTALISTLGIRGGIAPADVTQSNYAADVCGAYIPVGSNGYYPVATPVFYSQLMSNGTTGYLNNEYRGRVYGLKHMAAGHGTYGDIVSVKCDGSGFSDPNGTAADHFILRNFCLPL